MTPAEAAAAEMGRVYGSTCPEWHQDPSEDTPTRYLMWVEHGRRLWALAGEIGQDPIPGIDEAEVA